MGRHFSLADLVLFTLVLAILVLFVMLIGCFVVVVVLSPLSWLMMVIFFY